MKRFAVVPVNGGAVLNIVVGEDINSVSDAVGECVEETELTGSASIASMWTGSVFIPKPYPSWIWNGNEWTAPLPAPENGNWEWNETAGSWVER